MAEKKKQLKDKDSIFVKELIRNGGNQTDAALAAFPGIGKNIEGSDTEVYKKKRMSAAATASRKMKQPNIKAAIVALMDDMGLTDEKLLAEIRKGVDAPTNTDKMDWHTKLRFLETSLKMRGHFDDKDKDTTQTFTFLQMFVDGEEVKDPDPNEYTIIEDESTGKSVGGQDS